MGLAPANWMDALIDACVKEDPSAESHGPEHKHNTDGTKKEYGRFDFERYPFCEDCDVPHPLYEEIDQKFSYELEAEVFALSKVPKPPNSGPDAVQLNKLYQIVVQAHEDMAMGIEKVKSIHPYFLKQEPVLGSVNAVLYATFKKIGFAVKKDGFGIKSPKDRMKDHFDQKKNYFLALRTYLHAMRTQKDENIENREEIELDFYKASLIQLCHVTYSIVRSACHSNENARRKNNDLVMTHTYSVCMSTFNEYKTYLEDAQSHEERVLIYKEFIIRAMASLLHDYLEDFGNVCSEDFLRAKLTQHTTNSTNLQVIANSSSVLKNNGSQQSGVNPLNSCGEDVIEIIKALIKPSDKEVIKAMNEERLSYEKGLRLEPHIEKHVFSMGTSRLSLLAIATKLDDRLDNIETLVAKNRDKGLSIDKQIKKIMEAGELIQTSIAVLQKRNIKEEPSYDRLKVGIERKIVSLKRACVEQCDRIIKEGSCDNVIQTAKNAFEAEDDTQIRVTNWFDLVPSKLTQEINPNTKVEK